MPQLQVKVVSAEEVWRKGDLAIFKLTLEYNGQQVQAKTYSKTIANSGWEGTVETYEKEGRNGSETFVKQPQREGFTPGSQGTPRSNSGGGSRPSSDNFTMYLSYAKDIAIACVKDGKFDDKLYSEVLEAVEAGGAQLYQGRPDAPAKPDTTKSELDQVFGDTEQVTEEDTPWTEPPQLPV